MNDTVPYQRLNATEKDYCLGKVAEANKVLRKWEAFAGNRKGRKFRRALFATKKHPVTGRMVWDWNTILGCIPKEQRAEFRQDIQPVLDVHSKPDAFLGGQTVEWAIICSYSNMARQRAKSWHLQGREVGLERIDLFQEAIVGIIDAIYGYKNSHSSEASFTTYVWHSMNNRVRHAINRNRSTGPIHNDHRKLLSAYEERERNENGHVTYDEIVSAMGLDDEQQKILNSMLARVLAASQIAQQDDMTRSERSNDYTAFRSDLVDESDRIWLFQEIKTAFERANLSEFEQEIVLETVRMGRGSLAAVAARHINPNTGKAYTRMRFRQILEGAYGKLRRQLKAHAA